jgi:signal transduction histidine kinase
MIPFRIVVAATLVAVAGFFVSAPTSGAESEARHEETRLLVDLVLSASELVAEVGAEAACEEFSREGSQWRSGESYVFVIDFEGDALCHPVRPGLEGSSVVELRDPSGRTPVKGFLRELADGSTEGWVHYQWPTPEQPYTFYWKSTYVVRGHDPEGRELIVGSGLYQMEMERFFVTDQVGEAAERIAAEGAAAFPELRDATGEYRFYDVYLFVLDAEGNLLVNAGFPENEQRNVADLVDVEGRPFVREMLQLVGDREAGWVEYQWPRPGDRKPSRKSSYIRRVDLDGETVIVGAGVYLD